MSADVEEGEDVRVGECGGCAGFLLEALHALGVARHLRAQQLDRDLAAEPGVAGTVDLPHPARAERRDDLIRPQPHARMHGPLILARILHRIRPTPCQRDHVSRMPRP